MVFFLPSMASSSPDFLFRDPDSFKLSSFGNFNFKFLARSFKDIPFSYLSNILFLPWQPPQDHQNLFPSLQLIDTCGNTDRILVHALAPGLGTLNNVQLMVFLKWYNYSELHGLIPLGEVHSIYIPLSVSLLSIMHSFKFLETSAPVNWWWYPRRIIEV